MLLQQSTWFLDGRTSTCSESVHTSITVTLWYITGTYVQFIKKLRKYVYIYIPFPITVKTALVLLIVRLGSGMRH